jgi:hypothetical protein
MSLSLPSVEIHPKYGQLQVLTVFGVSMALTMPFEMDLQKKPSKVIKVISYADNLNKS